MMDEIHIQQKIKELEIHIDWIRSNLGSGPHLDKRAAEYTKLRNISSKKSSKKKRKRTKTDKKIDTNLWHSDIQICVYIYAKPTAMSV